MKTFTRKFVLLLLVCMAVSIARAETRADAEKDPVLKAMLTELDRSATRLKLENYFKPFFIQYMLDDVESYEVGAEYGALVSNDATHQRRINVVVRVGDATTDSSGPQGDGYTSTAVLEDDPIGLRTSLWWASDNAYKAALREYSQKLAKLEQLQTPPQAKDFSVEKPVIHLEPVKRLSYDEKVWPERITELSGLYRSSPELKNAGVDPGNFQSSSADLTGRALTRYIVNSEGTIVRKSDENYREVVSVAGQTDDGMEVDRFTSTLGASIAELEAPETFSRNVVKTLLQFDKLRTASIVTEEYHGPVLFSGKASSSVLEALFVPGVLASRPELGTEVRTNGPYASSLHTRVLPLAINVTDDPQLTSWEGKTLLGSYAVDDEGVPAESVELVEAGKLEGYLMDRQPIRDFPGSNGHGRTGLSTPVHTSVAVLRVTARDGMTDEQLKARLKKAMEENGLDHAYVVERASSNLTPDLLYRVDGEGNRTLVRGASLDDLDQRALRSGILAAGSELTVNNSTGDVPTTVLTPELLFGDVTVKRATDKNNKLPYYPSPLEDLRATK